MNSPAYQRALILHQQRRYPDAEKELRQALSTAPHDGRMHAMLALCLAEQQRFREASDEAQQAVGLEPDLAFAHYALAKVLLDRNRPGDAAVAINEAIRLDPYNPDYFALFAAIRFEQRSWPGALEAAERGLQADPEHEACNNLRAMALVKLGRRDAAGQTIAGALHRNPENSNTHANQGWTLLHDGNSKQAMLHFREALRLDATNAWAKAGIVEAIKARNPVYRWLLMYFLWMARLSKRAQWGILLGGYVGYRVVLDLARQSSPASTWLWPLVYAYIAFAALTWLAAPLFNLMLRLHPIGKYALSREQRITANIVGGLFLAVTACLVWYFRSGHDIALLGALGLAALVMPASSILLCQDGWPRIVMASIAVALVLILTATIVAVLLSPTPESPLYSTAMSLIRLFFYGALASSIAANYLVGVKPKR